MTGPKTGPSSIGTPMMAIARPIRLGPAAWAIIACPAGISMPPPSPWRMRKTINDSIDHANEHSAEPITKQVSAVIQVALDPNRSIAHPVIGMTSATASR